jgi:C4-dicarboxylate-specific signal transduction histidine kinase
MRTQELGKANEDMQKTLGELQATQQELIQREKLASLGRMIGGIAHELNTPIGNALTVITTIGEGAKQTKDQFDQGRLSKHQLAGFIEKNMNGVALIEKSLNRASGLISSFQKVAKDQSVEPKARFDLASALETARAMGMHNKPENIILSWNIDANIEINSKAGVLGQVVAQLVDNAMKQAFEKAEEGQVEVRGSLAGHDPELGDCALIEVMDNGKGISKEDQRSMYDPLFTTALHNGAVGLGLHNVYTMATRDLRGQIEYSQRLPRGSRFAIKIALDA